jgi:prepilin-type N-terminal cleavage/methylation domain-containing protein
MMKLRRSIGFTLIEVLLVIGLLGSVTAIAAPNLFGTKDNAEEAYMPLQNYWETGMES